MTVNIRGQQRYMENIQHMTPPHDELLILTVVHGI